MDGEAERAWLQRRHDAVRTPRAVIEARIRAAAGAGMASFERLVVGEDNEVYDVTTTAGERLIVRISHAEDPRFEAERWALDAARAAGVPTPVVRHLEAVTLADGRAVTCCVEERLPGTPLDVLLRNGIRPSRAIAELGGLLAAIHGIPVDGFGYLRPDGRGWPITFASMMTDLVPRRDRVLAAARHWRVDDQLVLAGLDLLAGHTDCYRYDETRLVHGDFSLDHILVDGPPGREYVSGIIDLQECAGGHPVSDVAYWRMVCHDQIPLATLLRGYPGGSELAEREADLIELMVVRRALWMLVTDLERGNPHRIGDHVRALEGAVAALVPPDCGP